jgi:hypothetical protein
MQQFTDILGGLANSAANVIGAINGQRGQNNNLSAAASQEQALRLEAQQKASAGTQKVLLYVGLGVAALLAVLFFTRKH